MKYVYASASPLPGFPDRMTHNSLTTSSAFVAGRSRQVIMQNMEERIARGDIDAEKKEAIEVNFPTLPPHSGCRRFLGER
jgi:hypothetical protein